MHRRHFLRAVAGAVGASFLTPLAAFSAAWNKAAFQASSGQQAQQLLGITSAIPSTNIKIAAPDRAENGAVVQVEIVSQIAATEAIAIIVEKNPVPLIANFIFVSGMRPAIITRIKMAETDDIQVIVKSGHDYFIAKRRVEVFENGCG